MDNVLELSYEQWRQHPVTAMLEKALRLHRDTHIAMAIGHSTSQSTPADQLRTYLISAKNTDAIIAMVNDVNLLNKIANPPKQ